MSHKLYTARQAAEAVLKRTSELLIDLQKSERLKETAPSDKTAELKDPAKNPKEQAEGNNEAAGTTPTQVGQDGKNEPGFDEMKSALKLAKFIGHMHAKREMRNSQKPAETKPTQQPVGPRAETPAVSAAPALRKGETGHEKGIHTSVIGPSQSKAHRAISSNQGMSREGMVNRVAPDSPDKEGHKEVLAQIKAQPKPKLPR
jgi:hypothetical protein